MAELHDSITIHVNPMVDKEIIYKACLIDIESLVTDLTHSSLSLFLWWIDSCRILGDIWLCSLGSDPWLDWCLILSSLSSLGSCPCQSIPAAPLLKVSWLSIPSILRYVVTMAINIRRHSLIPRLTDRLTARTENHNSFLCFYFSRGKEYNLLVITDSRYQSVHSTNDKMSF